MTNNILLREAPEALGVDSNGVLAFLDAVEQAKEPLHSLMLLRHGCVAAEGWWAPHAPEQPHVMWSLSKSFTSSAVGMAAAEGRLSIDDPVLGFFPEDAPRRPGKRLTEMRVRHLLSMSTGHAEDTRMALTSRDDGNAVKAVLAQPVRYRPGTHFLYNNGATYLLSAILQKVTGETLLDYLRPRLFDPLGIQAPTWEMSEQGICWGYMGLSIRTEDIARFGQMYLQKGVWNGAQILPAAWVEMATSKQVDNSHHILAGNPPPPDWRQGYGFQFWRCRHNAYRGDGAFGQYCIVMPDQDAVVAITGEVMDMQSVLDMVWDCLLPALHANPLPANRDAAARLAERLRGLKLREEM